MTRMSWRVTGAESYALNTIFHLVFRFTLWTAALAAIAMASNTRTQRAPDEPINLDACRRLLGPSGTHLSDAELLNVRDELYAVAEYAIDSFHSRDVAPAERTAFEFLTPDERDTVGERAAVLEFEGGLARSIATRAAIAEHASKPRKGGDG